MKAAKPAGALQGRRIVITRPAEKARRLADRLRSLGAVPIEFPTVKIEPAESGPLDAALRALDTFDWIVFTSANGVEAVFARFAAAGKDARAVAARKVAAIGPVTAQALRAKGCCRTTCFAGHPRAAWCPAPWWIGGAL